MDAQVATQRLNLGKGWPQHLSALSLELCLDTTRRASSETCAPDALSVNGHRDNVELASQPESAQASAHAVQPAGPPILSAGSGRPHQDPRRTRTPNPADSPTLAGWTRD